MNIYEEKTVFKKKLLKMYYTEKFGNSFGETRSP